MEPIDWEEKVKKMKKKIDNYKVDKFTCPSVETILFSELPNNFPSDKTCGKYLLEVLIYWAQKRNKEGLSSKFTKDLVSIRLSQFGLDENSDYTPKQLVEILSDNGIGTPFSSYLFFYPFSAGSLKRLVAAYNTYKDNHPRPTQNVDKDKSNADTSSGPAFELNTSLSTIEQKDEPIFSEITDEEISSLIPSSDTSNLIEKDPVDKLIDPAKSLNTNSFLLQCALCVLNKEMTCGPYYFMSIFIPKLQITCENDNATLKLDVSHKSIDEHMTNISKLEETLKNVSDNCSTMTQNDLKRLQKKDGYNKESLLKLETELKSQNKLKKLAKNYASILTTAKRVYDKMNRLMYSSLWDPKRTSAKSLVNLYKKETTQSKKSAKADKNVEPTNFDTKKIDHKNNKNQKMPVFSPIDKEMKNLQEMEVSDVLCVFEKVEIERVAEEVRKAKIKTVNIKV